ncbi:hypothetical protein HBI82_042580 [Parastagonospora nodorum]|nr:hypothetical protein HBI97_047470 [Parastagonospora nodorum]KAH5806239.1 hypothetical protein HBI96_113630 [Parastagonospora nodorum]KAH5830534.1 hypothetical protein HBI94_043110 [Parastagonospora nodorum]KAH5834681.1 hypothetical protein HBI93_103790 [Parastagonospora nodorum]KAH5870752.1 hypothetical protein HBI90_100580 [Parastagonospora nodorum]
MKSNDILKAPENINQERFSIHTISSSYRAHSFTSFGYARRTSGNNIQHVCILLRGTPAVISRCLVDVRVFFNRLLFDANVVFRTLWSAMHIFIDRLLFDLDVFLNKLLLDPNVSFGGIHSGLQVLIDELLFGLEM